MRGSSRRDRAGISLNRLFRIMYATNEKFFKKDRNAWNLLLMEVSRQALKAFEGKGPVVWTTSYVFPMEMLAALDIIPVDFEIYAGILAGARMSGPTLRASDRAGVPVDTCTVHRMAVGAALMDLLPRPDLLISTTHYCDGKAKTNEFMVQKYGVEYLLLDMPLQRDKDAMAYLEAQLRGIFERLCRLVGRDPDEGLLIGPIRHFNEMTHFMKRACELRRARPSPSVPGGRGFTLNFLVSLLYGRPEATEVYRRFVDDLIGVSLEDDPEAKAFRLLWLMAAPSYRTNIFDVIRARGGRIVMEEMSQVYWDELDEENPIRSLARRMMQNRFMGPVEWRADAVVGLARAYEVDAAIHMGHIPCRQANGALWVIKERLHSEGIRLINLEMDINDPSGFHPERIREYLMINLEILANERKP